jgi:hypothetical protein
MINELQFSYVIFSDNNQFSFIKDIENTIDQHSFLGGNYIQFLNYYINEEFKIKNYLSQNNTNKYFAFDNIKKIDNIYICEKKKHNILIQRQIIGNRVVIWYLINIIKTILFEIISMYNHHS